MKSHEFITENTAVRNGYHRVWHEPDDDGNGRLGYSTHHESDPSTELSFHHAKSIWDRNDSFEAANKHIVSIVTAKSVKDAAERDYQDQYLKSLSDIEREWVMLHTKLKASFKLPGNDPNRITDKELDRYSRLGASGIIRKSLLDELHPSVNGFITEGYNEIEFVCVNSDYDDATNKDAQRALYHELKQLPGVIPLWQDWSESGNTQCSLTAIYKDAQLKKQIIALTKKHGIAIDLIQPVTDDYIDRAIRGEHTGQLSEDTAEQAISLTRLGKFHKGEDTLGQYVPERLTHQFALHPDKWEHTFYSLTLKDPKKLKYYGPQKVEIKPGTLVGDMALANQFYWRKDPEEKKQWAEKYKASLQPYPVDISKYKYPELLIPK